MQEKIFLDKEGDSWFARNEKFLNSDHSMEHITQLLSIYPLAPKRILDIGSSNGWLLSRIAARYGAEGVGVDPSKAAVADGNKRYKNVTLHRGIAHDIPEKRSFDLVVANFVFHWISREKLFTSMAEVDRMIADGGHLIIADFLPDAPTKTRYHHLPQEEVYTYKLDYPQLFASTGSYRIIGRLVFDHREPGFSTHVPLSERCVVALIEKSREGYYKS